MYDIFFQDGSKEESKQCLANHLYITLEKQIHSLKDNTLIDDRTSFTIGRRYLDAKRVGYRYIIVINEKSFESDPLYEFTDTNENYRDNLTENQIIHYIRENTVFYRSEDL